VRYTHVRFLHTLGAKEITNPRSAFVRPSQILCKLNGTSWLAATALLCCGGMRIA
jgi:hypothetical protein